MTKINLVTHIWTSHLVIFKSLYQKNITDNVSENIQKDMSKRHAKKSVRQDIPRRHSKKNKNKKKACHEGMARSQAGKAGQVKKTKPERQTIITKHNRQEITLLTNIFDCVFFGFFGL